ncbi:MAG: phosphatidate cytidylyltransferase [Betaproteobacteria bacterium]|nr:phosphatidate cytidylyltransferase [Betaproteobacteria bacterium]MDE2422818.1 phosphatidate cytidylyltransferase [Betaproteobacteria bacterium]
MLKQRVVTAFFLLIGMLWALFFSTTNQWTGLVSVIALVAFWEWSKLGRYSLITTFLYLLCSAAIYVTIVLFQWHDHVVLLLNFAAVLFWLLIAPLWLNHGWPTQHPLVHAVLGWLLVFSTVFSLMVVKAFGAIHLLILFSIIWLSDSTAYFVGRAFGRHKLAPRISPGKTWEGVMGALVAVMIYGFSIQFFWPWQTIPLIAWLHIHPLWFYCLILLIALLGIEGDLFESWLKRCVGVKDSGFILPGHGGILDRIDALIATLPVMALWTEMLVR